MDVQFSIKCITLNSSKIISSFNILLHQGREFLSNKAGNKVQFTLHAIVKMVSTFIYTQSR